jgi:hypothetical protein
MEYILVGFTDMTQGYQVIQNGTVTQYVDTSGNYIFDAAPDGLGSWVIDPNPPHQGWMI